MAFPNTAILESFNIPDENPLSHGGIWTATIRPGDTALRVLTNQCKAAVGPGSGYRNDITVAAPLERYITVAVVNGGSALYYCLANPGAAGVNGYLATHNASQFKIIRVDANVETILCQNLADTLTAADVYGVSFDGTTHTGYRNGSPVASMTAVDSTYTTGRVGIWVANTTCVVDGDGGGALAGGGSNPTGGVAHTDINLLLHA